MNRSPRITIACGWLASLASTAAAWAGDAPVDFARDVRPILSDFCYRCHGPDATARKSELRLDQKESALKPIDGRAAVVPEHPDESELLRRVSAESDDERMPPAETGRRLSVEQIAVLRRWIAEGANWGAHWSFVAPERPELPAVEHGDWPRGAIDRFVLARLERAGLAPSPEADKQVLLRRVTLDLTGLPPTPAEVQAFLADTAPEAYERAVDRLLASPAYGERMALEWLDAARFADSDGYQGDNHRSMWPWRDWVVRALNANMPFDEFTIEQLAGDLLPDATVDQRLATGFNRNHRHNDEDGIIPEEFLAEYVADRTETLGSVWLGLTIGCARCHDHKYDPITQREYYRLFAFFNSVEENGRASKNAAPLMRFPTPEQAAHLAKLDSALAQRRGKDDVCLDSARIEIDRLEKERQQWEQNNILRVMVMQELAQPRTTWVLTRGAYDKHGQEVVAGLPASLPPLDASRPVNRLDLARWLVSPTNPLTARVTVNRFWQIFFGQGLVRTPEDFGAQGSPPTHPELLDWLASELVGTGWNVKAIERLIVTSATYRQSSHVTPQLLEKDPDNLLLARMSRVRLSAHAIRDQALAASGLLVRTMGGPSVMTYQPAGLWKDVASFADAYVQVHGEALYRRSLYTFWKRTVTPPAMQVFDASSRETCTVRQTRTNTPLQALVLMNDVTYVEAARCLAQRVMHEAPSGLEDRLRLAMLLVLGRSASADEINLLASAWQDYSSAFAAAPETAEKLLAAGESPRDSALSATELAAYTAVMSTILNLDETITRN